MGLARQLLMSLLTSIFVLCALATVLEATARVYSAMYPYGKWVQKSYGRRFATEAYSQRFSVPTDWSIHAPGAPDQPQRPSKPVALKLDIFSATNQFGLVTYKPSRRERALKQDELGVIYDVTYAIDDHGRRLTVWPKTSGHKLHVGFFGCSFIFGEGLNDHETLPSQLAQLNPDLAVYNMGRSGGSIGDAIGQLTTHNNWDGFTPAKGLTLVLFDDGLHISRFAAQMREIAVWGNNSVVLTKDPQTGRYLFSGVVSDVYPLWYRFARASRYSKFLELIDFDWPPITSATYRNYAKAIADTRDLYQQKYPDGKLVVYIPPGAGDQIIPYLEEYELPYLNYSSMPIRDLVNGSYRIPGDGHPTADYNRIMAFQLTHDLRAAGELSD